MGWWFGRIITFELVGDPEPAQMAEILGDISNGLIDCTSAASLGGYAAYGMNIGAAVEPFIDHCGVELFDDGTKLRSPPVAVPVRIEENDLGHSAEDRAPRLERSQAPARSLPCALTLSYYDPQRDYQTGQMRATFGASEGPQVNGELPVVLAAETAKMLAESSLARRWAKRDRLILRLPPRFIELVPGAEVQLDAAPARWIVERCGLEEFVVVAEVTPVWSPPGALPADPGRALPSRDEALTATTLALFDLPQLDTGTAAAPSLYVAAACSSGSWVPVPLEISAGGLVTSDRSARQESVLGRTVGSLAPGQPYLLDLDHSIEVELINPKHWLEACDDQALVRGTNLAVVGREIIQFGTVEALGDRRFLLSRLVRGRLGTEWAMSLHASAEPFALLKPGTLKRLEFTQALRGSVVEVAPAGLADANAPRTSAVVNVEALRPRTPAHLKAKVASDGSLQISWTRRSRAGFSWVDEVDVPLGESRELYEVELSSPVGVITREVVSPSLTFAVSEVNALGNGPFNVSVQQIGDHARSRPAILQLN